VSWLVVSYRTVCIAWVLHALAALVTLWSQAIYYVLFVFFILMLITIVFITLFTKAVCHVFRLVDICYVMRMQVQLNTVDAVIYFIYTYCRYT